MKNQSKKRGLLASLGAMATVAALALGGAAANAAPPNMPATSGLVITKLEQPATAGQPANGAQISDLSGYTTIPNVKFEAYAVDLAGAGADAEEQVTGTNAWLEFVASVNLATALSNIDDNDPYRVGTTDGNGVINWTGPIQAAGASTGVLPAGLYVIRETETPAGVVAAGDFLVALPMTNPTALNDWLPTVYVYPKNAKLGTPTKTVNNAGDFIVGDTVTWTISADLPRKLGAGNVVVPTDYFEVSDKLTDAQLVLNSVAPATGITAAAPGVTLNVGTGPGNGDYYIVSTAGTGPNAGTTTHQVIFNTTGLAKLATSAQASSTNRLTVTIDTTVKQVGTTGNQASIFPDQSAKDNNTPQLTDIPVVKYGTYGLNKVSSDSSITALGGVEFKVYLTKDAAEAAGSDNLKPAVTGANYNPTTGVWTTAANGEVDIAGLRYSNFADNAAQTRYINGGGTCTDYDNGDNGVNCAPNPKFQTYWLVEVKTLSGHQLLAEPIPFEINDASPTQAFEIVNQKNTNGFVLPLTGGMGTALLTIGGIAILATVLLVARRRRDTEAAAE